MEERSSIVRAAAPREVWRVLGRVLFTSLLAAGLAGAQSPVFHPVEGRAECLACHAEGAGRATLLPVDHPPPAGEPCESCHPRAGGSAALIYGAFLPFAAVFTAGAFLTWRAAFRPQGTP